MRLYLFILIGLLLSCCKTSEEGDICVERTEFRAFDSVSLYQNNHFHTYSDKDSFYYYSGKDSLKAYQLKSGFSGVWRLDHTIVQQCNQRNVFTLSINRDEFDITKFVLDKAVYQIADTGSFWPSLFLPSRNIKLDRLNDYFGGLRLAGYIFEIYTDSATAKKGITGQVFYQNLTTKVFDSTKVILQ